MGLLNNASYLESKLMIIKFFKRFVDIIEEGLASGLYKNTNQGYYANKPIFKELWIDDEFQIELNDSCKKIFTEERTPIENSLNVGGFIDAVLKDYDNNITLVDYKTSKKYKNVFSEDYINQLSIYAYLWEKQFKKMPNYLCVNFLRYDESFYILVTPSLIQQAKSTIKSVRASLIEFGIDKSKYYKKESKLCDYCNFKDMCSNDCGESNG